MNGQLIPCLPYRLAAVAVARLRERKKKTDRKGNRRHGRQVFLAGIFRLAGWFLLMAALILAAVALTNWFYGWR